MKFNIIAYSKDEYISGHTAYNSTFAAQNRQVHLNIIGQTRKPLL